MGEGEGDVVVLECRLKAEAKLNCELMIDSTDRDSCAKAQTEEVPGHELCTVNPMKEATKHMELDPSVKTPSNDGMNDTLLELHEDSKEKETLNAIEYENHAESKANEAYMDNELTTCAGNLAAKASTDIKFQHFDEKRGKEAMNDKNDLELSDKKQTKECLDNVELENGVKEESNEDVVSEVYMPYVSMDNCMSNDMNPNMYGSLFHDYAPNRELKMSKKVGPDNYPTNVKSFYLLGFLKELE